MIVSTKEAIEEMRCPLIEIATGEENCTCLACYCMFWRCAPERFDPPNDTAGFCGLAGRPLEIGSDEQA